MRGWSAKNKDRIAGYKNDEATFRASRKTTCSRYGITPEDYAELLVAQGNVCAVCREPETLIRKNSVCQLAIDHDHQTGRIRGLLCNNCNRALGMLNDNPEILRAPAAYLEEY